MLCEQLQSTLRRLTNKKRADTVNKCERSTLMSAMNVNIFANDSHFRLANITNLFAR